MSALKITNRKESTKLSNHVQCPYCQEELTLDHKLLTTYGTDELDSPIEYECHFCYEKFFIEEHVQRLYITGTHKCPICAIVHSGESAYCKQHTRDGKIAGMN